LSKLYEMFGGFRVLLQIGAVHLIDELLGHRLRRLNTNWSKVKPEKQLEDTPKALKDILLGTFAKKVLTQSKNIYLSHRNREIGTKAHSQALEKVMHGSVNEYFDITPIGRVIQQFNSEIHVFRLGLLHTFQGVLKFVSKAAFCIGFLVTVS